MSEVGGAAERRYPASEVRGGGREELPHAPKPKARGGSLEEQPHIQGAEAVQAQEGLEELLGRVPYKMVAAPFFFMAPVHVSVENAQ